MKFLLKSCALLLLSLGAAHAQGGPPMITDDPGTPGDGHWEINVALLTEHRDVERLTAMPLLDLNYGVGDRLQLKYEAAWLRLEDETGRHDGLSNSLAGVKWRFYDAGEKAWSASVYPQLEFNNPGSNSDERGLADSGTAFELPFQVMRDFGAFEFNADLGYVWHHGGNEWFGGVVIGREVAHGVELAAELHLEAEAHFHETALTANVGVRVDLSERCTLLASVGRELHNNREQRATLVAYLGLQTRL
jgi:hypothetical protein